MAVWLGAASAAQATTTISAEYLGPDPSFSTVRVVIAGTNNDQNRNVSAGRFLLQHGALPGGLDLLGGNTVNSFLAFCIEPLQSLSTNADYELVALTSGTNSVGGVSASQALAVRELFGRNAPNQFVGDGMSSQLAAALQVALWEIVSDGQTGYNFGAGNFRFNPADATQSNIFSLAQTMLSQLDGTGPLATGLRTMRNGSLNTPSVGSQDLLVFTNFLTDPIPEPSSWAMLIAGFGLVGAAMRRRRMPATA